MQMRNIIDYPEYDALEDPVKRRHAVVLSTLMDRRMILNRENYETLENFIDEMLQMEKIYMKDFYHHA